MSIEMRMMLIVGALGTMIYFLNQIRKSRLQIEHTVFWSLFSLALVLLSLVPQPLYWLCRVFQIQSPTNMVYLLVIFLLILKLFFNTLKISKLDRQITELAQEIALEKDRASKADNSFVDK